MLFSPTYSFLFYGLAIVVRVVSVRSAIHTRRNRVSYVRWVGVKISEVLHNYETAPQNRTTHSNRAMILSRKVLSLYLR